MCYVYTVIAKPPFTKPPFVNSRRGALNAALLRVAGACLCLLAQEALETARPRRLEALAERDSAQPFLAPSGQLSPRGERWLLSADAANETHESHQADAGSITADSDNVAETQDSGAGEDHVNGGSCWREKAGLHGEGGVKSVGKVTLTTAWLLVGSLGLSMVGLYLVNYDDPQVRGYIWNLISSTISIFVAVGVNHAIQQLIFVQLIPSPHPRGLGICNLPPAVTKAIRFVLLGVSGAIVSLSCKTFTSDPHWQQAASSICAHIHGFAGIVLFGTWQQDLPGGAVEAHHHQDHHFDIKAPLSQVGGVLAIAFITAYILTEARIRLWYPLMEARTPDYAKMSEAGGAYHRALSKAGPNDDAHQTDHWRHLALEFETEASSMYLSFCTSQFLLLIVVKHMAPMHYSAEKYPSSDIRNCFFLFLGLLALLTFGTWIRNKLREKMDKLGKGAEHAAEWLQMYTTMTTTWVLLRVFIWGVKAGLPKAPDLVQVVTAAVVTMFGIVAIIGIDKVADNLGVLYNLYEQDKDGNRVPHLSPSDADEVKSPEDVMEKALRDLIAGISLLVGVSWERAFEAANYGIVDGTPALADHPVVSFIVLMFVLVSIVIPAWKMYIVPMAAMKWEEHSIAMSLEKCREVM